ncbi:hypothetical protein HF086_003883 [Spodoptera exigua]|uniref:Regulatory protein zeste n=1 Tax=Spodoptera exigua TaxID=7107 RepID=A0A922MS25_SPOEX|nr:hypothetical protein HF086_003883 [Spodoptera exigua]
MSSNMSDITEDDDHEESPVREGRASRPTLAQLLEIISFMEEHPDLASRRKNVGLKSQTKYKKLWTKLAKLANSVNGPKKTRPSWIKIDVMDEQTAAMTQLSEATLISSKALEQIADASHEQALAVDRVAGTFESINVSVNDIRNALLGIDYTMKRCYPATQQRQNNIFS